MSKKGALELSMNSIIVFVLAIIVMSALVVAIRGILGGITVEKIQQIGGPTNLPKTAATYNSPITVGGTGNSLNLKPLGKNQKFAFDYFNKGKDASGTTLTGGTSDGDLKSGDFLKLHFSTCYGADSSGQIQTYKDSVTPVILPQVTSVYPLNADVSPGSDLNSGTFSITERGLPQGSYTCKLDIWEISGAGVKANTGTLLNTQTVTLNIG